MAVRERPGAPRDAFAHGVCLVWASQHPLRPIPITKSRNAIRTTGRTMTSAGDLNRKPYRVRDLCDTVPALVGRGQMAAAQGRRCAAAVATQRQGPLLHFAGFENGGSGCQHPPVFHARTPRSLFQTEIVDTGIRTGPMSWDVAPEREPDPEHQRQLDRFGSKRRFELALGVKVNQVRRSPASSNVRDD